MTSKVKVVENMFKKYNLKWRRHTTWLFAVDFCLDHRQCRS